MRPRTPSACVLKLALFVPEESCASAAYYIAAGADKIFVDKASIVGSIGVLMDGFGFTGLMDKLGIERRLLTAGENKGFLDPFSNLEPAQVEHVHKLLAEIHQQFINTVQKKRRAKLADDPELFSGLARSEMPRTIPTKGTSAYGTPSASCHRSDQ